MQEMAAGLGVNCDFCHVRKGEEIDFPADGKEEKAKAREMIAMTMALNKSDFKGRSTISCYTCHRGKNRPTGLVPLPLTPPVAEEHHESAQPKLPAAAEVVKKYAEVVGDAAKWSGLHAKGVRESLDGKQATPFDLEANHGKYHIVLETPKGKAEQRVSAEEGSVTGVDAHSMSATEVARFHFVAGAYDPPKPGDINTDPKASRVVGTEKIGDHDTYSVFSIIGPKSRQRLYFDTKSGLLVRRVVLTESPVGTIPSQTDFEDWKDVDGTKYPTVVRWTSPEWRAAGVRKYGEVRFVR
jgi:hypothetical protein